MTRHPLSIVRFALALLVLALAVSAAASADALAIPWQMEGHDAQHTGLSSAIGPNTLTEKWHYDPYLGRGSDQPPLIAGDGAIYIPTSSGLAALNPDGSRRWLFAQHYVEGAAAIGPDGSVYVKLSQKLIALGPDGTKEWEFACTGDPTVAPDGSICVWGDYEHPKLYDLYPDGSEKWEYAPPVTGAISAPAIAPDGTIYATTYGGTLLVIAPDGSEIGRLDGHKYGTYVAIGADGTVYATRDGVLGNCGLCAIALDGTEKWVLPTGGLAGPLAVGPDGTIYAAASNVAWANPSTGAGWSKLIAVAPNGSEKWEVALDGYYLDCPPIVDAAGTVYVISGYGTLKAIAADGSDKWNYTPPWSSYTTALGPDGTLYFCGDKLQAFGPGQTPIPPTISIGQPSASGTISGPVTYTVTYTNASVVTLRAIDVRLNCTGTAQGKVSVSAPSEFRRTITVSGISGDGTISVSIAAGSASNAAGPAFPSGPSGAFEVQSQRVIPGDWCMFGRDAQHSRCSSFAGPAVPICKWSFPGYEPIWYNSFGCAIDSTGTLYAARRSDFHTIGADGLQKWVTFTDSLGDLSNPAIAPSGNAFVTSSSGKFYLVSSRGEQWWSWDCGNCRLSAPVVGPDGNVYFGTSAGNLYSFYPYGAFRWTAQFGPSCGTPAIASNGTIYVASDTRMLSSVRYYGTGNWTITLSDSITTSPSIGADGTVYVGCNDGRLYAINPDGSVKWQFQMPRAVTAGLAIAPDGTIYAGCSGELHAIRADGSAKWQYSVPGNSPWNYISLGHPAVDAKGIIYFGTSDCKVRALCPDGSEEWVYQLPQAVACQPLIGPDGTLYISSEGGIMYALAEDRATDPPAVTIDGPSSPTGTGVYTIKYQNAALITLSEADVKLIKTGNADGTVIVSDVDFNTRQVVIRDCTGNGTISMSLAAGTARNAAGLAPEAGPSAAFAVTTLPPTIWVSGPSATTTANTPVHYYVSYTNATSVDLKPSHITLNCTGRAAGVVAVDPAQPGYATSITVTPTGGEGTISVSIAAGSAHNSGGETAAYGPSQSFAIVLAKPSLTISAPSAAAASTGPVDYTITYVRAGDIKLWDQYIHVIKTGTANGWAMVLGDGLTTRTVRISGITGNGSIRLAIDPGSASNALGLAPACSQSVAFTVVNTLPTIQVSSPSKSSTKSGPITYTVRYTGAASVSLSAASVHLVKTGTANGTISISGSGTKTRKVTVSSITGDGSLGISIDAGSASNVAGATPAVSGSAFTVMNTPPSVLISAPSVGSTASGPVSFTVTYTGAASVSLSASKVRLVKTGTANGRITVSGAGLSARTVTLSGVTGNGTLAIRIDAGTAKNLAGSANAVGPSGTVAVSSGS